MTKADNFLKRKKTHFIPGISVHIKRDKNMPSLEKSGQFLPTQKTYQYLAKPDKYLSSLLAYILRLECYTVDDYIDGFFRRRQNVR